MNVHHIQGYIQSLYLIEYPDKLLLLDGGCREDAEVICSFIVDELNRSITDLKVVIVTHMHPDHAGAANTLRKRTGCDIVSSKHLHHWYSGWDGWLMYLTDLCLAKWVAKRQNKPRAFLYYWPWLKPDIRLTNGENVPGFEEWQIIETPGHTDRDLSVRHIPSNRIYVADLMVRVKGRYIPPFPVFYTNNYRKSIDRVMSYQPDSLWLAHAGEIQLDEDDLVYLINSIPKRPTTHWRAVKYKLSKTFGLIRNR